MFLKTYGIGFYKNQRKWGPSSHQINGGTAAYISAHHGIDFFVRKKLAMRIDHEAGTVGIGTNQPVHDGGIKLDVGGQIRMNGGLIHSDKQLKQNIQAYSQGLDLIKKLNVFKYELKKEAEEIHKRNEKNEKKEKVSKHIGLIAQELQQLAPDLVHGHTGDNGEETLAYDFTSFTFLLVNSIKELNAKVEEQQQLIEALQKKK